MQRKNIIRALATVFWLALIQLSWAAEYTEKQVKINGLTINYSFLDQLSSDKEPEVSKLVSDAFGVYSRLFGGLPRDLSGKEYSELSIHLKRGEYLGGEADPQIIMLTWSDEAMFGYSDWRTALLHEIFHLWSAESFKYKDSREHWFNEGFAEYYAFKTATGLGLIAPDKALSTAAYPIGFYSSAKGLGKLSMREAGKTNESKFANYFLIYHGGWVVAMILDLDIRTKTNGLKNLDDLMALLYKNFPRDQKLYKYDDIISSLKQSTGIDYTEFLSRYVNGKNTIPIADFLPLSDALWAYMLGAPDQNKYRLLYQTLGISITDED